MTEPQQPQSDHRPADTPGADGPVVSPFDAMRRILMVAGGGLVLLVPVAWLALDGEVTANTDDPLPWILLAAGTVAALAGTRFARSMPLRAESLGSFVALHRTGSFIGMAAAELPALLGFVAAFIVGALWPLLIGLAPTLIGLWLLMPTPQRIRDLERALRSRGHDIAASELLSDQRRTQRP